jgi:predicted metal-dependent HD superfamily phosphohydrolase
LNKIYSSFTHLDKAYKTRAVDYLKPLYEQEHRIYHDFDYMLEPFHFLESLEIKISLSQYYALLFTYSIYLPGNIENLTKSIHEFKKYIKKEKKDHNIIIPSFLINRSILLMRAIYQNKSHPFIQDSKLVIDLKNMRLATNYLIFKKLEDFLAHEYLATNAFSLTEYIYARIQYFESLRQQKQIFLSHHFEELEGGAKYNINNFLLELKTMLLQSPETLTIN